MSPALRRSGWVLWATAPLLALLSFYRPASSGGRAPDLPDELGQWRVEREHLLTDRDHTLLGTDDVAWRTYEGIDGEPVFMVAVFHDSNWKSIHPPHICLEGSNMDVVRDDRQTLDLNGREQEMGRLLCQSRDRGMYYLSYYVFGTGEFTSSSYQGFFLHHLPRAVVRASNSGFLMRVETWVGEGGEEAARRRCEAFLADFLPAAEALLQ